MYNKGMHTQTQTDKLGWPYYVCSTQCCTPELYRDLREGTWARGKTHTHIHVITRRDSRYIYICILARFDFSLCKFFLRSALAVSCSRDCPCHWKPEGKRMRESPSDQEMSFLLQSIFFFLPSFSSCAHTRIYIPEQIYGDSTVLSTREEVAQTLTHTYLRMYQRFSFVWYLYRGGDASVLLYSRKFWEIR